MSSSRRGRREAKGATTTTTKRQRTTPRDRLDSSSRFRTWSQTSTSQSGEPKESCAGSVGLVGTKEGGISRM